MTHLIAQIDAGRCIAFVGAGFSRSAGVPDWTGLIRQLADEPRVTAKIRAWVSGLLSGKPTAHELDRMAQVLEDRLGRRGFTRAIGKALVPVAPPSQAPLDRLKWLREIPFRAVLTTNFDRVLKGRLPSPSLYRDVLRDEKERLRWWSEAFWKREEAGLERRMVKLHGDIDVPKSVVLTSRDYRKRLYQDPHYVPFLRGLFAQNTVLFMGFSFADAYLNELRSQVLALFDHHGSKNDPLAYAIINDLSPIDEKTLLHHQGVRVLSYSTENDAGHCGFDRHLQTIWSRSASLPRFGRLLKNRRILWMDPARKHNGPGLEFLKRATGAVGDETTHQVRHVDTADEAISVLETEHFDLIISHWGHTHGGAGTRLLKWLAQEKPDHGPVIIFAGEHHADDNKRAALRLGAIAYTHTWEALFRQIHSVFVSGESRDG